jgi:hypothetical protein
MPQFLGKNESAPVFKSKAQQLLADAFRASAAWTESTDIDVIAMFTKGGVPTEEPMSVVYQAGSANASTRTLKVGDVMVGTLFDDDTDGVTGNQAGDTLEAAIYFNKKGESVGYDGVIFAVLSYKGIPLKSLQNPAIKVEPLALSDGKFTTIADAEAYNVSFADIAPTDTCAIVAMAYLKGGDWQWKNITKGCSTKPGPDALGDFWNEAPRALAQSLVS